MTAASSNQDAVDIDAIVTHRFATLSKVTLHYVEAGEGPLVLLLHGYPEFWFSWRKQIPELVRQGYRVVAPDMRGYGLSDKPAPVSAYRIETLVDDVVELIATLGATRANVVGHDWGAIVSWFLATWHPDKVERLAILNVPHPGHYLRMLLDPVQLRRSGYVFFFQLPGIAERDVSRDDFAALRHTLATDPQHADAFTPGEIQRYVEAQAQPDAVRTTIHYYRALLRRNPFALMATLRPIDLDVEIIWGRHDKFLGIAYATPPVRFVPRAHVRILDDASHWVQNDCPQRVNQLLVEWLARAH